MGSPYYQATTYSRTDLRAHIIRNRYVDLSAGLNLHITPDVCALWQQINSPKGLHVSIICINFATDNLANCQPSEAIGAT